MRKARLKTLTGDSDPAQFPKVWEANEDEISVNLDAIVNKHVALAVTGVFRATEEVPEGGLGYYLTADRGRKPSLRIYARAWIDFGEAGIDIPLDDLVPDQSEADLDSLKRLARKLLDMAKRVALLADDEAKRLSELRSKERPSPEASKE